MATGNRSTVVGVFTSRDQARDAVERLRRAGFRDDQIGVVSNRHDAQQDDVPEPNEMTHAKVAEGTVLGAATGAGVGALWALGIGAALVPPLGIVVGGPIMALVASAGTGATLGTLLGALVGLGVPEDEAQYYEAEAKAGRTLLSVEAGARFDEARTILRQSGAYDMESRPTGGAPVAGSADVGGRTTV